MTRINALLFFLMYSCQAAELPDYINPCHQKEPNLGKCIEDRASEVLPILLKGDKVLNLPPLSPYPIEVTVAPEKTYTFTLKGQAVLDGVQYRNSTFNLETLVAQGYLYIPKLVITGQYEIDGKFLGKPIKGNGLATIVFEGAWFGYTWSYSLIKKDGVQYMDIQKTTNASYKIDHYSYSFTKNGKPEIELNDNQTTVFTEDIAPSITRFISDLSIKALTAVTKYANFEEVFLP